MTTIYGECVSGATRSPVTILRLRPEDCMLSLGARARIEGDLELWIGAIGPFGITASESASDEKRGFMARFHTPLEPAIINHFNA